jgi:hypothetical protein
MIVLILPILYALYFEKTEYNHTYKNAKTVKECLIAPSSMVVWRTNLIISVIILLLLVFSGELRYDVDIVKIFSIIFLCISILRMYLNSIYKEIYYKGVKLIKSKRSSKLPFEIVDSTKPYFEKAKKRTKSV